MSGLESMSTLSEANAEAETQQRLQSTELWRRLELHRLAYSQSPPEKRAQITADLLRDVNPRLLFLAVDSSYREGADEIRQRAVEVALISVVSSPVGPELFQTNAEMVPFFLAGLCHPSTGVKTLTVKALVALGQEQPQNRGERCRALVQPPLLPALVARLGDGHTGVAQAAADALVCLCDTVSSEAGATSEPAAAAAIDAACRLEVMTALSSQLGEVIAGLTNRQASTLRLRFVDTAARLMSVSDSAFAAALEAGALLLLTDLTEDSSDPLLQLNALELLEQVASSAAGARYLIANGHLRGLLNAAGGGAGGESPASPDPLLGTSALRTSARLFVKAAGLELDVWNEVDLSTLCDGFLRACTIHIKALDEASKLAGLVAVSEVAKASNAALRAMLSQEHGSEGAVLDAWLTLSHHKVDVKAAALHALASALGEPRSASPSPSASEPSQNEREERSRLARALMDRLGTCNRQSPGAMIVGLAKQPVPEIRHAACNVLRCTVWQPGGWGLSAVFSQPGFREFLEKREAGTSKATKEWKFSVVEGVMQCPERGVLGQDILDSFHNILKQGPFFVPRAGNVATLE